MRLEKLLLLTMKNLSMQLTLKSMTYQFKLTLQKCFKFHELSKFKNQSELSLCNTNVLCINGQVVATTVKQIALCKM